MSLWRNRFFSLSLPNLRKEKEAAAIIIRETLHHSNNGGGYTVHTTEDGNGAPLGFDYHARNVGGEGNPRTGRTEFCYVLGGFGKRMGTTL